WRQRCPVELGRVVIRLAAHGGPAFGTEVVVLVAGRQNEQEVPPRWGRAAAPWAKEAGCLELTEAVGEGHNQIFSPDWSSRELPGDRGGHRQASALDMLIGYFSTHRRGRGHVVWMRPKELSPPPSIGRELVLAVFLVSFVRER